MNVTVFGGSGFLGSHVADALTEKGMKVTIFDKVKSPYLGEKQNMVVGDVLDKKAVADAVKDAEVVYNFTALSDIEEAYGKPYETAEINIMGNLNILEAIKDKGIKRYVFSSSVYVYSDRGSFYRSSKQACELFIEDFQREYGLNFSILRYGSLYGPRANQSNWIYRALKQALSEGKITREGDGEEIREYVHVKDAAKLSVDILDEKYTNRHLIITGNEPMKIKDLLVMVKEILQGKLSVDYVASKENLHYEITPYIFNPKIATKLYGNEYLDMGQGILEILNLIHSEEGK
jgi:UDP-glucose 4-epimerase